MNSYKRNVDRYETSPVRLFSINKKQMSLFNPFAPGDFVLKLVEWFSGHCPAIKS